MNEYETIPETPENNTEFPTIPEEILGGDESVTPPTETEDSIPFPLTRAEFDQFRSTVETGFQQSHVDIIMIQDEFQSTMLASSLLLCGLICAVTVFRGLLK